LRIGLVLLVSALLFELTLRLVLFGPGPVRKLTALRQPDLYASHFSEEFAVLKYRLRDPARRRPARHDPKLGWTHQRFDPKSYDHVNRARLQGRRPVLLYGDSFAGCVTPPAECWQGLLEGSTLGPEMCLMNYGVPGYGFDQTCLLLKETLDLWAPSRPIVVVSLLVTADMDRAALPFFSWPKPDWELDEDGRARMKGPVPAASAEWIEEHDLGIGSYAWRWFVHGSGILPASWVAAISGEEAHRARAKALMRFFLDELQVELEGRGLEWFVLVFHGPRYFDPETPDFAATDWHEPFLLEELEQRGIRHVGSRVELEAAIADDGGNLYDHFVREGSGRRHYTALGNRVVFETLRRGLRQESD